VTSPTAPSHTGESRLLDLSKSNSFFVPRPTNLESNEAATTEPEHHLARPFSSLPRQNHTGAAAKWQPRLHPQRKTAPSQQPARSAVYWIGFVAQLTTTNQAALPKRKKTKRRPGAFRAVTTTGYQHRLANLVHFPFGQAKWKIDLGRHVGRCPPNNRTPTPPG